jgi:hypothetical protein
MLRDDTDVVAVIRTRKDSHIKGIFTAEAQSERLLQCTNVIRFI